MGGAVESNCREVWIQGMESIRGDSIIFPLRPEFETAVENKWSTVVRFWKVQGRTQCFLQNTLDETSIPTRGGGKDSI